MTRLWFKPPRKGWSVQEARWQTSVGTLTAQRTEGQWLALYVPTAMSLLPQFGTGSPTVLGLFSHEEDLFTLVFGRDPYKGHGWVQPQDKVATSVSFHGEWAHGSVRIAKADEVWATAGRYSDEAASEAKCFGAESSAFQNALSWVESFDTRRPNTRGVSK